MSTSYDLTTYSITGGGGSVTDYSQLSNKPSINGHTLNGNQTGADLELGGTYDYTELSNKPSIEDKELSGNISLSDIGAVSTDDYTTNNEIVAASINALIRDKQDKLVSGTNIKTINSQSILGEGDIVIEGGGGDSSYNVGHNDAKAVADVPVSKRLVVIETEESGTLSLASDPADGYEVYAVIKNTGKETITITMPAGDKYKTSTECIAVDPDERGEVSFISDGSYVYVRAIGTVTRNYSPKGTTAVTSLKDIPIANELVIATVSASDSISLASTPVNGKDIHIIVKNEGSDSITVTLPADSPYILVSEDKDITLASGKYAEVNIASDGTNMYVRGV